MGLTIKRNEMNKNKSLPEILICDKFHATLVLRGSYQHQEQRQEITIPQNPG